MTSDAAISVRGLRKTFRRLRGGSSVALDGLDLDVPRGSVFGFLGPNGSGKTTMIRCLLGLVRPDGGTCAVLGRPVSELGETIGRIGAIVETPTLFGGFTGRRNLEALADIAGVPGKRIDAVLEQVGLAQRQGDLVKTYSLGMKQRLGLAAALMKEPDLIVLDEPANGLDPSGLREIRDILRGLASQGRTVFLSSHLLSEVQLICDTVGIVSRGKCVASGGVAELLKAGRAQVLIVRTRSIRKAEKLLASEGYTVTRDGDTLHVSTSPDDGARVNKLLASNGVFAAELRASEISLEDIFMDLTEEPGR